MLKDRIEESYTFDDALSRTLKSTALKSICKKQNYPDSRL